MNKLTSAKVAFNAVRVNSDKGKQNPLKVASLFVKYGSLIIGALAALIPIIVVFFASLKTRSEYASTGPLTPPENWFYFENYTRAFMEGKMLLGFMNTAIILIVSIVGATLLGSMIAFVLHRFHFKGKKLLVVAFLLATLIPGVTTQVATFQIINDLGLFNTRLAAIILYLGTDIIAVYIFLQFLDSVSISLDESAMLEGASYWTIYWKIILPLLKPAIVTVIIVKGVGVYNDFYTPFLYMPKTDLQVISTALFKFKGPYGAQWEVISAGIMIAIIPTVITFLALQKYIYNGFSQGSVK
ncbi:carbohydrate ABC transporter permease [Lysinibacillus piscis]|uniref:Sugar ABC transporter permease n=1 Tax=Lysinibacillus piscis TaxID=2518931 RepID=A0ABQ5NN92_9BACI|nr:carbohydrate ABC transporter permease [Lysinibacillus sp. KH24]GLC89583.1 sugar ABC transporter permease [Lysinibacillus sp. KH24]